MSGNDYMYAPHCARCGIRVGAPRLVPEDYKPVRTLCFTCPGDAKPKRVPYDASEAADLEREMNQFAFAPAFADEWGDL